MHPGLDKEKCATVVRSVLRSPLFVPIVVMLSRRGRAGVFQRQGIDQIRAGSTSADLGDKNFLIAVAEIKAAFEECRKNRTNARMPALAQAFDNHRLVGVRCFAQLAECREESRVIQEIWACCQRQTPERASSSAKQRHRPPLGRMLHYL